MRDKRHWVPAFAGTTEKKEQQSADIEEKRIAINNTEAEGEKQAPQSRRRAGHDGEAEPKHGEAAGEHDRWRSRANHREAGGEPDHAFRF